ncbi:MAG: cobalt-zinc-cadmium efflux system membrane fusion protein [Glaciecola sp.]|jgi:cobalt-zinc-cadmium efflux system membrane fusion protein
MKKLICIIVISLIITSCQNNPDHKKNHKLDHGHDHDNHGDEDHDNHAKHDHSSKKTKKTKTTQINFSAKHTQNIDFAVEKVALKNIHQIINTSGQIEAMQGDEQIITAKTSGILLFNSDRTFIGKAVSKNQNLCVVSGEGLTNNNIESKYKIAKATYEKAISSFERGKKLVQSKIITQSDFEDLKAAKEISKTEYLTLQNNFSNGGKLVQAPFSGFVKNILIKEGQHVKSGDILMIISKNKKLIIKAEVSQKYFSDLPLIRSANFVTSYDKKVHDIQDFNGKLLSYGKNVNTSSNYLPVYFEIDNKGELLPGAFIEVYLKTRPIINVVTIPVSAIMEDYDNRFVFIRTAHETYEKRFVKLGVNNGQKVQVLSGIKQGDWVVTKGAYQIKMASASSSIPSHGHSH